MSDESTIQPFADESAYYDQVLQRFSARARSFNSQVTILLIFAFAFLVFVIVPLAALNFDAEHVDAQEAEREDLAQRSKALEAERAKLASDVDTLRGNITSLNTVLDTKQQEAAARTNQRATLEQKVVANKQAAQKLEDQATKLIQAMPEVERVLASFNANQRVTDLRDWFLDAAYGGPRDPQCTDSDERAYMSCLVRRKLEADWERDFSLISREVVEPLKDVAPNIASAIESTIHEVKQNFRDNLAANRSFWRSIGGKAEFMDQLEGEFHDAFEVINDTVKLRLDKISQETTRLEGEVAELEASRKALEQQLAGLDSELAALESEVKDKSAELDGKVAEIDKIESERAALAEQQAQIESRLVALPDPAKIDEERARIETRLSSFQSPFGTLPIGLNEAVLAYPLILAVGFTICALLLGRLLYLRSELHSLLQRQMPAALEDVNRRLEALAPIWFDPQRWAWRNVGAAVAFGVPLVLFGATGWLILNDWLLHLGDTPSAVNIRIFYGIVYAVGVAIFVAGIVCLVAAAKRYRRIATTGR